MEHLFGVALEIWSVLREASPYILAGLFVAGIIQMFLNEDVIVKHLGTANFRSVLWAAALGVPLPLCSCGVLPAAMSLRKKGASKGATISFLISTPESGIDSFLLSFALLDPIMAFFRPIAAFLTAVIAGAAENIFGHAEPPAVQPRPGTCACSSCGCKEPAGPVAAKERFLAGMKYSFVDMLGDIGKWLLFGIAMAGIISYAFPQSFIERFLGAGWHSMFLMLLIGIPMYICASASTPIAAALILKGMSPGAALVFLLAGPATNTAGITVIAKVFGTRTVTIYLAAISITALCLGGILNGIYAYFAIDPKASIGHAAHAIPHWLGTVSAISLLAITLYAIKKTKTAGCCGV